MAKVINIRNVPDEVYRKAKVQAAREGITLRELIIRLLRNYGAEGEKEEVLGPGQLIAEELEKVISRKKQKKGE